MSQTPSLKLVWPSGAIDDFCRRWRVEELAVFGSALREDFGAASDVDLLVRFAPEAEWTLLSMESVEMSLEEEPRR